jgi:hypothetical protein
MKRFTAMASAFLALAIIGLCAAVYSIAIRNYILLAVSIIFAVVSADNIFCNLKKQIG